MSDDHFLLALDAMFDVMVLYDWVACIPIIGFLIDGLMARTSCTVLGYSLSVVV